MDCYSIRGRLLWKRYLQHGYRGHWPTYSQDKIMNAIKKHEPLKTSWPSYKIKNFRNSIFSDYFKARSKARTAEFTSDLNSEQKENAKRKIIQKVLSSSSSEKNLETLSLPQPLRLKKKSKTEQENLKELSASICDSPNQFTSYNSILSKHVASPNYATTQLFNEPYNSVCSCKRLDEKTIKNLVDQNYLIRSVVTEILSEVKELKLQIKNNSQKANTKEKKQISIFNNKDLNFPLQTEEDLQSVKFILENDDEVTKAINALQQVGGNNGYEFVRKALSMLITNKIADKYSFFGRKKKKSFCNLNICKIIISASQKGKYCQTIKECEKYIQGWLRRATERGKLKQYCYKTNEREIDT